MKYLHAFYFYSLKQRVNFVIFFCRLYGLAGAMHLRTLNYQNFSTKMGLLSWVRIYTSDLMSSPCFKMGRFSEIENPESKSEP